MFQSKAVKTTFGVAVLAVFLFGGLSIGFPVKVFAQPKADSSLQSPLIQPVNVNKATAEELVAVRGIGPVMAQRILEYRDKNGAFKSIDDLAQVRGMGGSKLQRIKDQVTV